MMINEYESKHIISKVLSANDIGINGTHQAGILIPKNSDILGFFPKLDEKEKNPRARIKFEDNEGKEWHFSFIYYNNRFFGGTRNEYRLTGMTSYVRKNDLKIGDEIVFYRNNHYERCVTYKHSHADYFLRDGAIRLSNNWKIIKIKEENHG